MRRRRHACAGGRRGGFRHELARLSWRARLAPPVKPVCTVGLLPPSLAGRPTLWTSLASPTRRGGRGRRRCRPLRRPRGGASKLDGRPPGGRRPVRARPQVRGRATPRAARRRAGATLARVLPDRPERRGDSRPRGGARVPPCPRRQARGRTHVDRLSYILWCPDGRGSRGGLLVRLSPCSSRSRPVASWQRRTRTGEEHRRTDGWAAGAGWGERALQLALDLGDTETALEAKRTSRGRSQTAGWRRWGRSSTTRSALAWLKRRGARTGGWRIMLWTRGATTCRRPTGQSLEYCSDHGLELFRLYLLSHRARLYLAQGRWAQAAETADAVLRIPESIMPRITALTVLGLVRARRGDPGHRPLLDEAWTWPDQRLRSVGSAALAAARAEAAWLISDPDGVASATELALALALRCGSALATSWPSGAPCWPWPQEPVVAGSPHGLQLAGSWDAARASWVEAGCPYEAASAWPTPTEPLPTSP